MYSDSDMIASPNDPERLYAVEALERYWPGRNDAIRELPIPRIAPPQVEPLPPHVELVALPHWAKDAGVNARILVPTQFTALGEGPAWKRTDWLGVVFWYLNACAERAFEEREGPIHSYAYRLNGWDPRLWERAWVNRIALFLRRWAARNRHVPEEQLFGPLAKWEVILSHDVDAIEKTIAIRLKQSSFHSWNAIRRLLAGRGRSSLRKFSHACRVLLGRADYWCFDELTSLEETFRVHSHFYVYGGPGGWRRSPSQLLFDPAYRVGESRLKYQLRKMRDAGWTIGLHQSFHAWADPDRMTEERKRVEQALGYPLHCCRQHWLRFSWKQTWQAQEKAGFALDSTLAFNDRIGFRNGAALRFRPWNPASGRPMTIEALPVLVIDSQLYNYADLLEDRCVGELKTWLDELRHVRGTAFVNWHQEAMSADYGWRGGYEALLSMIAGWT